MKNMVSQFPFYVCVNSAIRFEMKLYSKPRHAAL